MSSWDFLTITLEFNVLFRVSLGIEGDAGPSSQSGRTFIRGLKIPIECKLLPGHLGQEEELSS